MVILALPAQVRHPPTSSRSRHRPWSTAAAVKPPRKPNRKVGSFGKEAATKEQKTAAIRKRTVRICVEDPDATDDGSTDEDAAAAVHKRRRKVQISKASAAYYDDYKQVPKRKESAVVIDIPGPVPDMVQIMEKASALLLSFFDNVPDD